MSVEILRQFAIGAIDHRYMGQCPDVMVEGNPESRDPECAVCRALDEVSTPIGETDRGFEVWQGFVDRYGQTVDITQSSLATEDCLWIWPRDNEGIHLSVKNAKTLRDTLDGWLTSVE